MIILHIYILIKLYTRRYYLAQSYKKILQTPTTSFLTQYNHTYAAIYMSTITCHKKTFVVLFTKKYQGYIQSSTGTPHLVPHPVVGALHLHMHGVTGNLSVLRYRYVNLLFRSVLILSCWRIMDLQKGLNLRIGRYLIYFLWIS